MRLKRIAVILLLGLLLYLSLITWNLRTHALDSLAAYTGLEFVGWVLKPGKWVADQTSDFWNRYLSLVGVRQENDLLRRENEALKLKVAGLTDKARAAERLEGLLLFSPPPKWTKEGARVIAKRLGPEAALESLLLDKGRISGVNPDTPVLTPDGLVGRVIRVGASVSSALLVTDTNSRVPVLGRKHRSVGILFGQGPKNELILRYANQNAPLEAGEVLVTSGQARIFPKGLPVARVTRVDRSEIDLHLFVTARPLVDLDRLEEVLLLMPDAQWEAEKPFVDKFEGG